MNQAIIESIKYLRNTNQIKEAADLIKTLKNETNTSGQWSLLAIMFYDVHEYEEAIYCTQRALNLTSDKQDILSHKANLVKFYNDANLPHEALKIIKTCPVTDDLKNSEAFSYLLLNDKIRAKTLYKNLLNNPSARLLVRLTARYNLATFSIAENFMGSMLELADLGPVIDRQIVLPPKAWLGNEITEPLIILSEGGLGDDIINVRFCKYLTDRGISYKWLGSPNRTHQLGNLFSRHGIDYIDNHANIDKDSWFTSSMFLPLWLQLDKSSLWAGSYLSPSESYLKKWKWLESYSNKVGLRWTGGTNYIRNACRDLPLHSLIDVLKGHTIVSLQKEEGVEELKQYSDVLDLSGKIESFEDTLAIMHYLDMVITSCTSVAHAAGAMGKKCFTFVPINTYYVWETDIGEKSSWYGDNYTTLRQSTYGTWEPEISKLKERLTA